ncbi:MAG: transcription-repair coupling factor [Defluviitaleaceae bacterium]|nr:transcription-repair coupling factor [Defluviitaleaceae bacterium]
MNPLFAPLNTLESYQNLALTQSPILATGVTGSQKWHLAAAIMEKNNRSGLIITHSELSAKAIYEDMQYFFPDRCRLYPSRDAHFYAADVKSADITRRRFAIISELLAGDKPIIVLPAEILLDRLTPRKAFMEIMLALKVGDILEPEDLMRRLSIMGYDRAYQVEGPGQFAVRGGIVDICTISEENPALRIEFFGDEIDSIRVLEVVSQRSGGQMDKAAIFPMGELAYDDTVLTQAIANISTEYEKSYTSLRKKNLRTEAQALKDRIDLIIDQLSNDKHCSHMERLFPFFYDETANLLDYLPRDTVLFFDEPNYITTHLSAVRETYEDDAKHRLLKGEVLPAQAQMLLGAEQALEKAIVFHSVLFADMAQQVRGFTPKSMVSFTVKACPPLRRRPEELKEDLSFWIDQGYRLVIMAGAGKSGDHLAKSLTEMEITAQYVEHLDGLKVLPAGVVTVTSGTLATGFEYPECKLAVITNKEMFAKTDKKRRRRRNKDGATIDNFTDLRPGDYIVHDNHGVGIFSGIEQIVTDGLSRDYLKLTYADGGHLYVHTGQMDLIQKYIGGSANLKLNKLGGADWAKAKSRVRGAVKILAEDLVALYAKRQANPGFVYSTDTVWQSEFEAMFPYEETEDQVAAIEDVKNDMESEKIMDRLICGDVGYGKTEVAIRAAFKAVQDNKQVAYLVPTTILAQQHYQSFINRMSDYPVVVERLSRFQTAKEQKATLHRLSKGEADIVIGTHRLLSKDVKFHNLGLIIVDEEQRFGVSHKEKLKVLRENVDVMTLTATPIPRTLHLSLTGLRDMSLLNEPPDERQPVQTYVMEHNPDFVREAINRELARDGQVYYLHNRVRNIAEEAAKVRALVPHAKVAFAHGQMSEYELENIMLSFIEGEIQVLVCTTIVETGLDIPNVNTIIIQNADHMGLSQLYQLRGRVGRSNRLAYAYLMYRKDKILEETAQKRLQTIRDFTEFGAGFKIAMRDLEIRGAGNLIGAEQHGHMDAVGYDTYCRLLAEAISELKGEIPAQTFETTVDIKVDGYIPEYYIEDEVQKLEMYKKISLVQSQQDSNNIQEEIEDRFGDLPKSVQNLLDVALMKARAHNIGVVSIAEKQERLIITFKGDAAVDVEKLTAFVTKEAGRVLFTMAPNPYLTCAVGEDAMAALGFVLDGLEGN